MAVFTWLTEKVQAAAQHTALLTSMHTSHLRDEDREALHLLSRPEFKGWKIGRRLGEGNSASVYRIVNDTKPTSEQVMAFKVLKYGGQWSDASEKRRKRLRGMFADFKKEYDLLSQPEIQHPNIIKVGAFVCDEKTLSAGFSLEAMDGDLQSLSKRHEKLHEDLPEKLAFSMFHQILSALAHQSSLSITHLDIKLDNIMYRQTATGSYVWKLVDFGSAAVHKNLQTGFLVRKFAAPELLVKGTFSPKSDVWSLWVTLLTVMNGGGYRTFVAGTNDVEKAVVHASSVWRRDERFWFWRGCGEIDPRKRLAASEVLALIERYPGLNTFVNGEIRKLHRKETGDRHDGVRTERWLLGKI